MNSLATISAVPTALCSPRGRTLHFSFTHFRLFSLFSLFLPAPCSLIPLIHCSHTPLLLPLQMRRIWRDLRFASICSHAPLLLTPLLLSPPALRLCCVRDLRFATICFYYLSPSTDFHDLHPPARRHHVYRYRWIYGHDGT